MFRDLHVGNEVLRSLTQFRTPVSGFMEQQMDYCEAWQIERTVSREAGEEYLDGHLHPISAANGHYCIPENSGVRTLCGSLVYKLLPYLRIVRPPQTVCRYCLKEQTRRDKKKLKELGSE